jgi:hypothetical protein
MPRCQRNLVVGNHTTLVPVRTSAFPYRLSFLRGITDLILLTPNQFKMDPYDSDSSVDEDFTDTGVLLGYAAEDVIEDVISHLGGWPVCSTTAKDLSLLSGPTNNSNFFDSEMAR